MPKALAPAPKLAAPSPPDPRGRPTVHLLHIRKTAGTALKHALEPFAAEGTVAFALRLCGHPVRLEHVPPGDRVAFTLRDPVDRFVSGFLSRLRQGRPRHDYPWTPTEAEAFARFPTPEALALAVEADDPDRRAAALRAMRRIGHVNSRQWDWFGDRAALRARLDAVIWVGRRERLDRDFPRLCAALGLPEGLALPDDPVAAHRNPEGPEAVISEAAAAILTRWYRRDFGLLEFCERRLGLAPADRPPDWRRRLEGG